MSALVTSNPATGEPLAEYAVFTDAEVDAALASADEAQHDGALGDRPRGPLVLRRVADRVVASQHNTPGSLLATNSAEVPA